MKSKQQMTKHVFECVRQQKHLFASTPTDAEMNELSAKVLRVAVLETLKHFKVPLKKDSITVTHDQYLMFVLEEPRDVFARSVSLMAMTAMVSAAHQLAALHTFKPTLEALIRQNGMVSNA